MNYFIREYDLFRFTARWQPHVTSCRHTNANLFLFFLVNLLNLVGLNSNPCISALNVQINRDRKLLPAKL